MKDKRKKKEPDEGTETGSEYGTEGAQKYLYCIFYTEDSCNCVYGASDFSAQL